MRSISTANTSELGPIIVACSRIFAESGLPNDIRADALAWRGMLYSRRAAESSSKDDTRRALADLYDAARLDPAVSERLTLYFMIRASLHFDLEQYPQAKADAIRAIKRWPGDPTSPALLDTMKQMGK